MVGEKKIVFTTSHFSEGYRQWSWSAWIIGTGTTILSHDNLRVQGIRNMGARAYTESAGAKRGFRRWARLWYPEHELIYIETIRPDCVANKGER